MRNKYEIKGDIVEIYIKSKKHKLFLVTIIDIKNLEKVLKIDVSWFPNWQEDIQDYYVEATQYIGMFNNEPKYKRITLSRIIMDCYDSHRVDHITHSTLDNRESNLRITTGENNSKNRKAMNKNNKTGYRNVCQVKNKLYVQLQINGKNTLLRTFNLNKLKDASIFAEKMRQKYYGKFAGNS